MVHRTTAAVRLVGAIAAALALLLGAPAAAAAALIGSVLISGGVRFWTNAECATTFRAQYFSCVASHVGDVLVNAGAAVWLLSTSAPWLAVAPLLMIVLHLLGVVASAGALGVGVHVARLRIERLVRLAAISAALALAALGLPMAFVGAAAVLVCGSSSRPVARSGGCGRRAQRSLRGRRSRRTASPARCSRPPIRRSACRVGARRRARRRPTAQLAASVAAETDRGPRRGQPSGCHVG